MKVILALDPAINTGWAYGPSTKKPSYGSVELLDKGQPHKVALSNLGKWLALEFLNEDSAMERGRVVPDLVVHEEPLSIPAWKQLCDKIGRMMNPEALEFQHQLCGGIQMICGYYGVETALVRRQTVVKHFTGTAKHGGREQGKSAVMDQCKRLNLVPLSYRDDDACDAIANHDFASHTIAKQARIAVPGGLFSPDIKW